MSAKVHPSYDVYSERVKGVFVVSDPVDWGRDLQVLLSCPGLTNRKSSWAAVADIGFYYRVCHLKFSYIFDQTT
jgi:hypothetical protein